MKLQKGKTALLCVLTTYSFLEGQLLSGAAMTSPSSSWNESTAWKTICSTCASFNRFSISGECLAVVRSRVLTVRAVFIAVRRMWKASTNTQKHLPCTRCLIYKRFCIWKYSGRTSFIRFGIFIGDEFVFEGEMSRKSVRLVKVSKQKDSVTDDVRDFVSTQSPLAWRRLRRETTRLTLKTV